MQTLCLRSFSRCSVPFGKDFGEVLPTGRELDELEQALEIFNLPVYGCSFDRDLWVALRRRAASMIPVLLDHLPVYVDQIAIPKVLSKVIREHPVVSLTVRGQRRGVRRTKLVAQFRERQPLARPTNFEQTQRDFAVSLFPFRSISAQEQLVRVA